MSISSVGASVGSVREPSSASRVSIIRGGLPDDVLGYMFGVFFTPEELENLAEVSSVWKRVVDSDLQWATRCHWLLRLERAPRGITVNIPYKAIFPQLRKFCEDSLYGEDFYNSCDVKVGIVPPIPELFSCYILSGALDPCDNTQKIRDTCDLVCFRPGITINNLPGLFAHLPEEKRPKYDDYVWQSIKDQHGDESGPSGWFLIRREVIGRGLSYKEQKDLAKDRAVEVTDLVTRVVHNYFHFVRSKGDYLDEQDPCTYARTSTETTDTSGVLWPSGCGYGSPSGLVVLSSSIDRDSVGVAVELPEEVQAIGP